jgi:hypothetical protein
MPDRVLHVRQPAGFTAEALDVFRASAEIFKAHATKLLEVWHRLPNKHDHPKITYDFGPPALSDDGTIASLPISGEWTLGTRSEIEIGSAILLWRWMPYEFIDGLDQGRTEDGQTTWWPLMHTISYAHLDPALRARLHIGR